MLNTRMGFGRRLTFAHPPPSGKLLLLPCSNIPAPLHLPLSIGTDETNDSEAGNFIPALDVGPDRCRCGDCEMRRHPEW